MHKNVLKDLDSQQIVRSMKLIQKRIVEFAKLVMY